MSQKPWFAPGLLALMIVSASACGRVPGLSGAGSSTSSVQSPGERWPAQGDFHYRFIGGKCDTGVQDFGVLSEYCLALEDDQKNQDCAIDERRSAYRRDCGDDFREK